MNREELKAEALINLGSESAPKEWEKLPCIKEQMPSCIGGEVSLQRFVGTDICAWFVGIGGLWEPQSDYFRVSLPPVEGATDKFRDVLHEVQRLIETEGGATESEMKAIWNSLSCAITESERRSQPPAEGAEAILKEGLDDGRYADIVDGINIDVKQPFYQAIIRYAEDVVAAQQQPTAEGAEEMDARTYLDEWMRQHNYRSNKLIGWSEAVDFADDFATLHAQRIAEKMVEEKSPSNKQIHEAALAWARDHSEAPDKDCPDWLIRDYEAGAYFVRQCYGCLNKTDNLKSRK